MVFPAGLALTFKRRVRRPGAPPERSGGEPGRGLWALTAGSQGSARVLAAFLGLEKPASRVGKPDSWARDEKSGKPSPPRAGVCLLSRGQVARAARMAEGRGRGTPAPPILPRPSPAEAFLPGSRLPRRVGGSEVHKARAQGRNRHPGEGHRGRCPRAARPRPVTFVGRRRPRQLAARRFAARFASPPRGPGSRLHFRVSPPGGEAGPAVSGLQVAAAPPGPALGREEEQRREEEVAGEAAARGASGYTGSACPGVTSTRAPPRAAGLRL